MRRKHDHGRLLLQYIMVQIFLQCPVFFTSSLDLIISCLSLSIEKLFNHRTSHPQPSRCVAERVRGETTLMFRVQMTETSNPKHGCVVEMHASVHCQPVGMLTDDAPDSSFPLSSSLHSSPLPPQSLSDSDRPPPTHPHASTEHGGKSRKHTARLFTAHRY